MQKTSAACCTSLREAPSPCVGRLQYELDSRLEHRNSHALLTEVTLDLSSGGAAQRVVAPVHCEFPTVPASLLGEPRAAAYPTAGANAAVDRWESVLS